MSVCMCWKDYEVHLLDDTYIHTHMHVYMHIYRVVLFTPLNIYLIELFNSVNFVRIFSFKKHVGGDIDALLLQ